ncbi:hypothetical protein GCM10023322_45610 [Rugosimonospora acidiphila]|uniref:HTH hxlR-type domain-containing protein n=1 Tax=Rugosimonospora acidiphila TaxID=556531 RepID=A0ABP9S248_9ACTN
MCVGSNDGGGGERPGARGSSAQTGRYQGEQRTGLVTRTSYPEVPPRVEYALTELGTSLLPTVLALASWSANHHGEIRRHQTGDDNSGPRGAEPVASP